MPSETPHPFSELFEQALTEPGNVHQAYTFHGYSLGNPILALVRCHERGRQMRVRIRWPAMATTPDKPPMLFSVRDTPRFPKAVWERFRARVTARGENWIDVLRQLVERYANEGEKKP